MLTKSFWQLARQGSLTLLTWRFAVRLGENKLMFMRFLLPLES